MPFLRILQSQVVCCGLFSFHRGSQIRNKSQLFLLNNTIMAFSPATRDWSVVSMPLKASTAFAANAFIYNDGTDNVPATTTTQGNVVGIGMDAKLVGDTAATKHSILVPNSPNSLFYGDVTGTLTAAMEGDQFDFADSENVAQAASTYDTLTLVKFISASKGIFKLNTTFGVEN